MEQASPRFDWWAIFGIGAGLYFLRGILTPFAMAVILWFVIDSLAHAVYTRFGLLPSWLARPIAIAVVVAVAALILTVVIDNIALFASRANEYQARLDSLLAQAHALAGLGGPPPTMRELSAQFDLRGAVTATAAFTRNLTADVGLTLVFFVFMFSTAASAPKKLDLVFSAPGARERARQVITAIQQSIRSYLLVQTVASFVTSALTFATLSVIGLDNALYWAVLIFFLNFIPVIGPIVAVALPTTFALMEFSSLGPVAATAFGVGVWPFLFGNFVLPRMTGRSLNLSPLVVIFALAFWATIWGVVGAFLATPLTVMIMIVLAQLPVTRPIAIILSGDGQPHVYSPDGKQ